MAQADRIRDLEQRIRQLEASVLGMLSGRHRAPIQRFGPGNQGVVRLQFEVQDRGAERTLQMGFADPLFTVDQVTLTSGLPYLEYRDGALVFSANGADEEVIGGGWLTEADLKLSGSLSGTTFDVQDGRGLAVRIGWGILVRQGIVRRLTTGGLSVTNWWKITDNGYRISTFEAPSVASFDEFYLALARVRVRE
jgi:hypothetical protein